MFSWKRNFSWAGDPKITWEFVLLLYLLKLRFRFLYVCDSISCFLLFFFFNNVSSYGKKMRILLMKLKVSKHQQWYWGWGEGCSPVAVLSERSSSVYNFSQQYEQSCFCSFYEKIKHTRGGRWRYFLFLARLYFAIERVFSHFLGEHLGARGGGTAWIGR